MKRSSLYSILFAGIVFAAGLTGFSQNIASTGISGGRGGFQFSDSDIPQGARVLEIRVFAGDWVDAVQIIYTLPNGRIVESARHGGSGGRQNIFRLDSDEYVTGVSGRYGKYIDSIRIQTNKRTSPVYGGGGGDNPYRINVPSGNQGVGFAGRSGDFLDAIGLTYTPIWLQPEGRTDVAGGRGGNAFSGSQIPLGARVSAVYIWSGDLIDRIQLIYTLRDGSIFEGKRYGGGGGRRQVFQLADNEYITGISGRHGEVIDSIKIHTNRRTSDTYGGRGGARNFNITIPNGKQAIGLTGRAGEYLDAIGLEYIRSRESVQENPRRRQDRYRNWR